MSIKSQIRSKYRPVFKINYDLRNMARTVIERQPPILTPKDGIACYMMAKTYKTHGVVTNLAKNGYVEDGEMLARTMFDCAVIISTCIGDESEETALKYYRFDDSDRAKMYKHLKNNDKYREYFAERRKTPKTDDESIDEIESRASQWILEYGGDFRQKWHSGQTMSDLANTVNLKQYYATAYALQSQLIHSLPRSMNSYLIEKGDKLMMVIDPRIGGSDLCIVSAFHMLALVTSQYNKHFSLGIDNQLNEIIAEWGRVNLRI